MAGNSEKEPLYAEAGQDEFYETSDTSSPVYDNVANSNTANEADEAARKAEEEEWKADLAKLEDEIQTLRQVLGAKVNQANLLKRKLGITPIQEIRSDIRKSVQSIKETGAYKTTSEKMSQLNEKITGSQAYQKTNEKITEINEKITHSDAYQKTSATLKNVGQKTGAAISSIGAFTSRKIGDMRNSNAFKSFEEKVGGAYSNVKHSQSMGSLYTKLNKVRGSQSEHNFDEAVASAAEAEKEEGAPLSSPQTPEQKVPL